MSSMTLVKLFPRENLQKLAISLQDEFISSVYDEDNDVILLKKNHIQTANQAYKFNLITTSEFNEFASNWCKSNIFPTTFNMFMNFYNIGQVEKRYIFQDLNIIMTSWHQSPLLNVIKGVFRTRV
jgi:hypothetical protein